MNSNLQPATPHAGQFGEDQLRLLCDAFEDNFAIVAINYSASGAPLNCRFLATNQVFQAHIDRSYFAGGTATDTISELELRCLVECGRVAETGHSRRFLVPIQALGRRFEVFAFRIAEPDRHWVGTVWSELKPNQPAMALAGEDSEDNQKANTPAATAQLRAAELEAMIESMNDAVYIGGMEGITLANQAALDQLGFNSREELNRHVATLAEEIDTRDWKTGEPISPERQAFARALQGERVVQDVRVRHRLTKEERVVRCAAAPIKLNGRVIAAVAVNTDVTEQRKAQAAVRESERYFRAFVQASAERIFRTNANWSEMYALGSHESLFEEQPSDRAWVERYVHPEDQENVLAKIREAISARRPLQMEHRVVQPDGTVGWVAVRAVPMRDERDEIEEWFGTAVDITLRKNTEKALLESEKLAVVGRLASSIAHEINNPLEAVVNLVYLAEATEISEQTRRLLDMAQKELNRVSHIVSETLRFHRQSTRATETLVSDVTKSVLALHQGRIHGENVSVEQRYRQTVPVLTFANDLRQVIANAVGNALDAMRQTQRRRLLLRTRQGHDPLTNASGVWITIADTGVGMSAHTRERIFEPFFTTKGEMGTGLGLWVAREIVKKHQGRLLVRSRQNSASSGTVFLLFLSDTASGTPA